MAAWCWRYRPGHRWLGCLGTAGASTKHSRKMLAPSRTEVENAAARPLVRSAARRSGRGQGRPHGSKRLTSSPRRSTRAQIHWEVRSLRSSPQGGERASSTARRRRSLLAPCLIVLLLGGSFLHWLHCLFLFFVSGWLTSWARSRAQRVWLPWLPRRWMTSVCLRTQN